MACSARSPCPRRQDPRPAAAVVVASTYLVTTAAGSSRPPAPWHRQPSRRRCCALASDAHQPRRALSRRPEARRMKPRSPCGSSTADWRPPSATTSAPPPCPPWRYCHQGERGWESGQQGRRGGEAWAAAALRPGPASGP